MIFRKGFSQSKTEDGAVSELPGLVEALAVSDDNAKRAFTAYLFLAMEQKPDERLLQLFDEMFLARDKEAGEYSLAYNCGDFAEDRDAVIRICDAYLGSAEDSDERYELVVEAIRIEVIREGEDEFSPYRFNRMYMALLVYNLVLAGMQAGIYKGNRKKLVRFIVRVTKRDKAALAELEEMARKMLALEERVAEVKKVGTTDTYEQISAQLAGLQAEKQVIKEQFEELFCSDMRDALSDLAYTIEISSSGFKWATIAYLFWAVEQKPDKRFMRLYKEQFKEEWFMGKDENEDENSVIYDDFADKMSTGIRKRCDDYLDSAASRDERYKLAVKVMRRVLEKTQK